MATFTSVNGQYIINLDHVVKIEPLQNGICRFDFANGAEKPISIIFDPGYDLPRNETIIAAPPGWRVVVEAAHKDESPFETYNLEDVIAFRITARHSVPITAQTGDMGRDYHVRGHDYALVSPQGEVSDFWGERWANIEAFTAHERKAHNVRMKARAIAKADAEEPV